MKRFIDIFGATVGLMLTSPLLLPVIIFVWNQDKNSPFYMAERIGLHGKPFRMIKLRTMIVGADKTGVDSTALDDKRITPIGHFIRRYKLDELTQLYNVLVGDMSLVGPRPNVVRETNIYTQDERHLLSVKPGITDFSSIVFSDEGEILKGRLDPDLAYNQLIRPGKGYLGLFYIEKKTTLLDIQLCLITIIAVFSRKMALKQIVGILQKLGANEKLIEIASRKKPLTPMPPPGSNEIVSNR